MTRADPGEESRNGLLGVAERNELADRRKQEKKNKSCRRVKGGMVVTI